MEITNTELEHTIEYHKVTVNTSKGEMIMEVEVMDKDGDKSVQDMIESDDTDIWNSLDLEEKNEVEEAIENHDF